ncbi:hypothetical protein BC830DRAFT_1166967 [Chytriomyces sp. MP71]|nr:hypothetical protein BC830DRAFT_1166967 [Chytriomyces sp. MP71]
MAVQKLHFIVGVNPHIRSIYQVAPPATSPRLKQSPSRLPEPKDDETKALFKHPLIVASHSDVIPRLTKEDAAEILHGLIHARFAIRGRSSLHSHNRHHWVFGYIAVLNINRSPTSLIKSQQTMFKAFAKSITPFLLISKWPHHQKLKIGVDPPPIQITIACEAETVTAHDEGLLTQFLPGYAEMTRAFEYSYTTSREAMQQGVGGPIAGLGFGLPMSRIYAKYFGGSLELKSVGRHGVDAFIRIPSLLQSGSGFVL